MLIPKSLKKQSKSLTKCVYGLETDAKKTPFGLLNNQQKLDSMINVAGWFNGDGEKLGTGDLSLKDMDRISKNISTEEFFFVLTEADSNWNLPKDLDSSAPGTDYVVKNASWIIGHATDKGPLIIRSRANFSGPSEHIKVDNISYFRMSRDEVLKIFIQPEKAKDKTKEISSTTGSNGLRDSSKKAASVKTKSKTTTKPKTIGAVKSQLKQPNLPHIFLPPAKPVKITSP